MTISMQSLFTIVLLFAAIAVAWFDATELFMAWYSESTPRISVLQLGLVLLQTASCAFVVVVLIERFVVRP